MARAPDHPLDAPHEIRFEVMHMLWENLTFLHWPFDPEVVQAHLPSDLTVDTYDGKAWVGLIPFDMTVQLPGGLPIPREGRFPETNVRTYVRGPDGTPGVWFSSLEAGRLSASTVARVTYGLPYFWSAMTIENNGSDWRYRSTRKWPGPKGARNEIDATAGEPIEEQSDFDRYLTARWGLFSTFLGRTVYAPISHEPWPLHRAELTHLEDDLMRVAGFSIPEVDPIVHWTPGVSIRIGRPRLAANASST